MEKKLNPGAQKALALKKNRSSKSKGTPGQGQAKPITEEQFKAQEDRAIDLEDSIKAKEESIAILSADLRFEKGLNSLLESGIAASKVDAKHWSDLHTQRSYQVGEERGKKLLYKRWVNIAAIAFAVALISNFIPRPDDCDPCQRVHQQENPLISTGITPPVDTRILATVKAYVDTSGVWRSADDGEPIEPLEWKRLSQ